MGKWEWGLLHLVVKFPYFKGITSVIFGAFLNKIYHSFQRSIKLCLDWNLIQSE